MRWFYILLLSSLAWGQSSSIGGTGGTGTTVIGTGAGSGFAVINGGITGLPTANAQLSLFWAKSKGSDLVPSYDVTLTLGTDYPCGTAAQCFASLQQEYCDWAFSGVDQNWHAVIPHGTIVQTGTAVTCSQTGATTYRSLTLLPKLIGSALPAKYFVIDSDTPLPEGTTVCSHAIDDTAVPQPPTGDISSWWTGSNYGCGNDRPSMWTLEGNWNSGNAGMLVQAGQYDVGTNLGPSHVVFKNYEFRPIPSNVSSVVAVNMNEGALFAGITLRSQAPSDIHFINGYRHGDAKAWCNAATGIAPCISSNNAGGPGNNRIATFIALADCQNCSVTYGYSDWIISQGAENHDITILRSFGPDKIAQNYMSGSSMAVFTGGVAQTDPLFFLFDCQITSNRLTNPISWVGPNYHGAVLTLKNRLELKIGQRCEVEGNILENQDTSGGQEGQAIGINPRDCSGGSICNNYTAIIQDVTVQKNILRHALTGFSDAASSGYSAGNGGGNSPPLDHITIQKNLGYDLGSAFYDAHKAVTFPFFLRTGTGSGAYLCSGANASGTITLTCDTTIDGLRQVLIRPGDGFTLTNCSQPSWNVPTVATNVWQFTKGATALAGTIPTGSTVVYSNPSATGLTATGCVLQAQGAPYHQVVQHNTIVMQADAYPSAATTGTTADPVNGTASITGGLATVTVTNKPIVVPNVGKINVIGASIANYNCNLCLVVATTTIAPFTITYQVSSGNRGPETVVTGTPLQQPANNVAIYNGSSATKVFTDTGCSGGPTNSTAISAISRAGGMVTATVGSLTGWPSSIGASQILVEVAGSGTFNGFFYYSGQGLGTTITWPQSGMDEIGSTFGTAAQMGTCSGSSFAVGNTFKNNLVLIEQGGAPSCPATPSTGWIGLSTSGGSNLEGCPTGTGAGTCSENFLDALTSNITYTNFPGRCSAKYMEMGGGNAGAIPPVTLTFPPTTVCSGAAVPIVSGQPSCVGMKSMMNGAAFDINNPDYHQYVLDNASPYKAGGLFQADDGSDMGIGSLTEIDAAIHSHLYVCESFCGVNGGPYPD